MPRGIIDIIYVLTEIPYHQSSCCSSGLFLDASPEDPPTVSTATLGIFFGNRCFCPATSGAIVR